jgi:hypothetical protein
MTNLTNYFKILILNITMFDYKLVLYTSAFALSQLARLDFFSDVCFAVTCFKCDQGNIGYVSLGIIILMSLINIKRYFCLLFQSRVSHPLPTER